MMENNLEKLKSAANQYRLNENSQIAEKVLNYIRSKNRSKQTGNRRFN